MLRVHLEVCTPLCTTIGWLCIRNDGTGDADIGHYSVTVLDAMQRTLATTRVTGYPRALGPWVLTQLALQALSSARPSLDALQEAWLTPAASPGESSPDPGEPHAPE